MATDERDRHTLQELSHVLRYLALGSGIQIPPYEPAYYPNRFGLQDDDPLQQGVKNSGPRVTCVLGALPQQALACKAFSQQENNPGLASVHFAVTDANPTFTPAAEPTQRLIAFMEWQTGNGGGEALVDITQGSMFTIAGAHSVTAKVQLVSTESTGAATPNTPDNTFKNGAGASTVGRSKTVSACVQWGSTISRPAFMTGLRIAAKNGVPTGRQVVPAQASRMILLNDLAGAVNIEVDFWRTDTAFVGVRPSYAAFFNNIAATPTNAFWVPVVDGTEAISVLVSADANVLPIYELWL